MTAQRSLPATDEAVRHSHPLIPSLLRGDGMLERLITRPGTREQSTEGEGNVERCKRARK